MLEGGGEVDLLLHFSENTSVHVQDGLDIGDFNLREY